MKHGLGYQDFLVKLEESTFAWKQADRIVELETENVRLEELVAFRRELLDYDDKRILELSTENKELKEQCARLQQEYIKMFNQLYKE